MQGDDPISKFANGLTRNLGGVASLSPNFPNSKAVKIAQKQMLYKIWIKKEMKITIILGFFNKILSCEFLLNIYNKLNLRENQMP